MTHLLDTDTCSAHMRRPAGLAHRFIQYVGGLAISTVALAELYAGAYKRSQHAHLLTLIRDLLQDVNVLDFDARCAEEFGRIRGSLLRQGIHVPTADLMIASVALTQSHTRYSQHRRLPPHPRTAIGRLADAVSWSRGQPPLAFPLAAAYL